MDGVVELAQPPAAAPRTIKYKPRLISSRPSHRSSAGISHRRVPAPKSNHRASLGYRDVGYSEVQVPGPPYRAPINAEAIQAALFSHVLELDPPLDLGETPVAYSDVPAVQYYVMGNFDDPTAPGNEWRQASEWPPVSTSLRLHLHDQGELLPDVPDGQSSVYRYDPAHPAPTLCGTNLNLSSGPCEQSPVEERDDVLTFTTTATTAAVEYTGRFWAHLFVSLDQVDTDLIVRITDVYPDGRSFLITEGAARVAARGSLTGLVPVGEGEVVETTVDLRSASLVLDVGHRLGVSITSSSYPRYRANYNNGRVFSADRGDLRPVQVTLHRSAQYPSYVDVPLIVEDP